jgi:hypothetical protein
MGQQGVAADKSGPVARDQWKAEGLGAALTSLLELVNEGTKIAIKYVIL